MTGNAHIVVDAHIPFAQDIFSGVGQVTAIPGHEMRPESVKHADALVVRSITPIGQSLLEGSSVRFVGTATAGIDHIDQVWLKKAGIRWAHAPGANAQSVAEHALSAISVIARRDSASHELPWKSKTLGVIGCGRTGSALARMWESLGGQVLRNDPPRQEKESDSTLQREQFVSLDALCREADIVSLHVPLTRFGAHPTWHLLSSQRISELRRGCWVLNMSRGGTADEHALVEARKRGHLGALVLDVFELEPTPSVHHIAEVDVATGHVAGYSIDAKKAGVMMIRDALVGALQIEMSDESASPHESLKLELPSVEKGARPSSEDWAEVMRQLHDIEGDDHRFRTAMNQADDIARAFHTYRATYPVRRSFEAWHADAHHPWMPWLQAIGVRPSE